LNEACECNKKEKETLQKVPRNPSNLSHSSLMINSSTIILYLSKSPSSKIPKAISKGKIKQLK
jgi:hypothetical protein